MPYQTSTFQGYHSILRKFIGIDQVILPVSQLQGAFAVGSNFSIIDPALAGETLDRPFIDTLVKKPNPSSITESNT